MATAGEIPLQCLLHSASDDRFSLSSFQLLYKTPSFEFFVFTVSIILTEIPSMDLMEQCFINHDLPNSTLKSVCFKRKKKRRDHVCDVPIKLEHDFLYAFMCLTTVLD
jgi:hypothetical protein